MSNIKSAQLIPFNSIDLRFADVDEYCLSIRRFNNYTGFWWYIKRHPILGNFSVPFQDINGIWWYQVKPGFCWPVEILKPYEATIRPPLIRSFLGFQFVTERRTNSNSTLNINVIENLKAYDQSWIYKNKRRTVKKGSRCCDVLLLSDYERNIFIEALAAWNDLVSRTGWKRKLDLKRFEASWKELLDSPGTSILVAIDRDLGRLAGWLIVRIFGDTAYIDTIASNSFLLNSAPNDILIYTFLRNAQEIPQVTKAYYTIKSMVQPLERFKTSLGFKPWAFPSRLCLRPGFSVLLKRLFSKRYQRLTGEF